jgi:hypothetical protein
MNAPPLAFDPNRHRAPADWVCAVADYESWSYDNAHPFTACRCGTADLSEHCYWCASGPDDPAHRGATP